MPKVNIRQRRIIADYLNISPGSENAEYALLGTGTKTLDEQPTAQSKSRKYVCDSSTTKNISGYDLKFPFELDQIMEEKAIAYIIEIGEGLKSGSEAESDYVRVDLSRPVNGEDDTYSARRVDIAIEVATFGNDDGDLNTSGNFLGNGDWVKGKFNVKTKQFTADDKQGVEK